jgi:hypothetical protein
MQYCVTYSIAYSAKANSNKKVIYQGLDVRTASGCAPRL